MILTVSHTTVYSYDTPMRSAVQSLRLFPSEFDGQKIIDWSVDVVGGIKGAAFRDGAGDRIEGWSLRGPVDEVRVVVAGRIETTDLTGVLRGHRESVSPEVYLRATTATLPDAGLVALAEAATAADGLDTAHLLAATVADAIAYRPGATHEHTTAAEALAQGEGVCQDHAHALIAVAHARGLPARYVSGYLHSSEDGSPHEAAHAWAEIWVAGLGWVGFDPANKCSPDDRYIRLGSGLDSRDAAPIRGLALGSGKESLDVIVAIQSVQQ